MYAMPKTHISNNILAKTRRGFPQKVETLEKNFKENTSFLMNAPKPVFHFSNKKIFEEKTTEEKLSPQHEEMVKYIQSTWTNVIEQYESKDLNINKSNSTAEQNKAKVLYFPNKATTTPTFEPFDLESFWGQRIYQKLISA